LQINEKQQFDTIEFREYGEKLYICKLNPVTLAPDSGAEIVLDSLPAQAIFGLNGDPSPLTVAAAEFTLDVSLPEEGSDDYVTLLYDLEQAITANAPVGSVVSIILRSGSIIVEYEIIFPADTPEEQISATNTKFSTSESITSIMQETNNDTLKSAQIENFITPVKTKKTVGGKISSLSVSGGSITLDIVGTYQDQLISLNGALLTSIAAFSDPGVPYTLKVSLNDVEGALTSEKEVTYPSIDSLVIHGGAGSGEFGPAFMSRDWHRARYHLWATQRGYYSRNTAPVPVAGGDEMGYVHFANDFPHGTLDYNPTIRDKIGNSGFNGSCLGFQLQMEGNTLDISDKGVLFSNPQSLSRSLMHIMFGGVIGYNTFYNAYHNEANPTHGHNHGGIGYKENISPAAWVPYGLPYVTKWYEGGYTIQMVVDFGDSQGVSDAYTNHEQRHKSDIGDAFFVEIDNYPLTFNVPNNEVYQSRDSSGNRKRVTNLTSKGILSLSGVHTLTFIRAPRIDENSTLYWQNGNNNYRLPSAFGLGIAFYIDQVEIFPASASWYHNEGVTRALPSSGTGVRLRGENVHLVSYSHYWTWFSKDEYLAFNHKDFIPTTLTTNINGDYDSLEYSLDGTTYTTYTDDGFAAPETDYTVHTRLVKGGVATTPIQKSVTV
jgi:hypothetical protein